MNLIEKFREMNLIEKSRDMNLSVIISYDRMEVNRI